MKNFLKPCLFTLVFSLGWVFAAFAQSTNVLLTVTMNNGEENNYILSEQSRITFTDNEFVVITSFDASFKLDLADIRKMTCSEIVGTSENITSSPLIFPNPVRDEFHLWNLTEATLVSIYSVDGRLVKVVEAEQHSFINVSDLPAGLYLVKAGHNTLKMMKL